MVCYVNESFQKSNNNDDDDHDTITKLTTMTAAATQANDIPIDDLTIDENAFLHLKLQRIAGGSVIDYPPTYSPCGDSLFVISDDHILVYSTHTGEYVRDLDGVPGKRIIATQCDPNNPKLLYGCTESGDIISWKWKSGVFHEKQWLRLQKNSNSTTSNKNKVATVNSFSLIGMTDQTQTYGLIAWRTAHNKNMRIGIFNLMNGQREDVPLPLDLNELNVKVAVAHGQKYFVVIQGQFLNCVNYKTGEVKYWTNIDGIPLTCVACHPTQEMVATGDITGRILMYHQIFHQGEPITSIYHWHHTPVTTITFTMSGSNFYSGGLENTLCHWDLQDTKPIGFLPRMHGTPVHIVIGGVNLKIAVSTDDNGIQIYNPQNVPTAIVQNFTWIPYDKTNIPKFPIGLKVNPRTNCLVLNGRLGHLQFFSTHTRTLLYNIDISAQNLLNIETDKVLYNFYVSHASLNSNWLATAEILDDHEHTIESRLKFWAFDEQKQAYKLNTQIELPHENGVRCLEFSSPHSIDNLLCATSGELDVKIWSLEDSANFKREAKVWTCIARTNYKSLTIKSLAFSSDTSLLGVGFGNTLCIYNPESLQLRCALSAPSGLDGSVGKMTLMLPSQTEKSDLDACRRRFIEKGKKLRTVIRSMLETDDTKAIVKRIESIEIHPVKSKPESKLPKQLTIEQKKMLFNQILSCNSINLFQKINIFDKFGLHGRVPKRMHPLYVDYCEQADRQLHESNVILKRIFNLSPRMKFKFAYKFHRSNVKEQQCKRKTVKAFNRTINSVKSEPLANGVSNKHNRDNGHSDLKQDKSTEKPYRAVQKPIVQITHVAFCTGEFAHLAIVCTQKRLLIWNLLTLRIQSAYKIEVDKLTVDLYTSLVAIVTKSHDLYVFLPNTPITLYHHKQLPKIDGLAWIPRKYPKSHSLTIDWQAHTELYFLSSEKQELLRLVSSNDEDSYNTNAFYLNSELASDTAVPNTPFAAMIAKQQTNYALADANQEQKRININYGIGVPGKYSVKELTALQAHTMAPMNLFCTRFLKSLLVKEDATSTTSKTTKELQSDDDDNDDDDDDEDEQMHSD